MARVIVMGGIGTGKSTVSRLLQDHGYVVIEADRVGHQVLEPGGEAHAAVAEKWPEVVVDGRIDRGRLGAIVFDDLSQLRQLEAFTHPSIRRHILQRAAELPDVAVELPLLPEFLGPGWVSVLVDADPVVRRRRLLERGMDGHAIDARMAAQPDRDTWLAAADHVIRNEGSIEDLEREVERFLVSLSS